MIIHIMLVQPLPYLTFITNIPQFWWSFMFWCSSGEVILTTCKQSDRTIFAYHYAVSLGSNRDSTGECCIQMTFGKFVKASFQLISSHTEYIDRTSIDPGYQPFLSIAIEFRGCW